MMMLSMVTIENAVRYRLPKYVFAFVYLFWVFQFRSTICPDSRILLQGRSHAKHAPRCTTALRNSFAICTFTFRSFKDFLFGLACLGLSFAIHTVNAICDGVSLHYDSLSFVQNSPVFTVFQSHSEVAIEYLVHWILSRGPCSGDILNEMPLSLFDRTEDIQNLPTKASIYMLNSVNCPHHQRLRHRRRG